MKAISLWQPWASAVIDGRKRFETRSWRWPNKYLDEPILLHAAKTRQGLEYYPLDVPDDLPFGALLGVVSAKHCEDAMSLSPRLTVQELMLGDYSPGRFATELTVITRFQEPTPYAGEQGFFDVPDEALFPQLEANR